MRATIKISKALCVLLLLCSAGFGDTNKVLIVGIDGCRPDSLLAAKTPNIDKLWSDGAFSFHAKTDPKTKSGPCWTSILTGAWHTKHGILDNKYSVPSKIPHFFQRLKDINPELETASIVQWAPLHRILPSESADVKKTAKPDRSVADVVVETLSSRDPDAVFIQFDDVDHAGHKYGYGPHVAKYMEAIESTDILVGKIIEALERRDTYEKENWLIILTSDHGGIHKNHGSGSPQESTVFFVAHGKSVVKGEITAPVNVVDVAVTAMAHLHVTMDPKWNLDGKIQGIQTPEVPPSPSE